MVLLAKVVRVGAHYRPVAGGITSPGGRGALLAQQILYKQRWLLDGGQ